MKFEWKKGCLGDVLTLQRGMDLPVGERKGGRYPVVASTGVVGFHNEAQVKGPGVVIGRSGSIGGGQYIEGDFWPLNTTLWVRDFKGNNPRYCYYLLRSIDFSKFNVGSGVPTLNRNHIHPMEIDIPCVEYQNKAADILGSIDALISSVKSENSVLESIAQTIFKSWFINFDPVHAKAAGREPEGLSGEITTLFPSEFEESDLGLIPKGWKMRYFGDLVEVRRGGSPRPIHDYLASEGLPWVKISDATCDQSPFLSETKEFIKESGLKKTAFLKQGSLILSNSATPGVPKFLDIDACIHDGWLHFPSKDTLTDEFLFLYFRFFRDHIVSQGDGSVFVNLKTEILKSQTVVVAPVEVLTSFQNIVEPIFNSILINVRLARTLESIRNELLPRLISGKIRVEEAEEVLADVMPPTEKQVA